MVSVYQARNVSRRNGDRRTEEAIVNAVEMLNIAVVRKYFDDACNTGDIEDLMSTMTPDVVHYFLPTSFPPIRGAEHLARFWRKYKLTLNPEWKIDRIIASGEEVVSEWSCAWSPPGSTRRLMNRGTEWYLMRDGKIAEVRAYFMAVPDGSAELSAFPYAERGYLLLPDAD
jgi:ketosteroid isomerase-like protein